MNTDKKALYLISRLYQIGNKYIIEQLKANGLAELSPSHGDILAVLYNHKSDCSFLTMKDIASKIRRTKATVSVLIDKLEKIEFIKREKNASDARETYIILTDKGKKFKSVFEQISKDLNNMLYKNLSDSEALALDLLLEKMLQK